MENQSPMSSSGKAPRIIVEDFTIVDWNPYLQINNHK